MTIASRRRCQSFRPRLADDLKVPTAPVDYVIRAADRYRRLQSLRKGHYEVGHVQRSY